MTELRELAQRWANGNIEPNDLAAISVENRASILADQDLVWRRDSGEAKPKQGDPEKRRIHYVLSVERGVGYYRDVIIQSGWDFSDFEKRGRPFLWSHNLAEIKPWLGRMEDLDKAAKFGRVNALTGDAEFTPEEMNEFNDMVYAMVAGGFMPGGSVGFRVLASRLPKTEAEKKKLQLGEMSSVFEQCLLIEFSSVPVGMDPDANKQLLDAFGDRLTQGIQAGEFRREVADELRGRVFGVPARTTVVVPGAPFQLSLNGDEIRVGPITQTQSSTDNSIRFSAPAQIGPLEVQAVLVPTAGMTQADAKARVREQGFRAARCTEADGFYRFDQFDAAPGAESESITLDRARGIKAVLSRRSRSEDMDAKPSLEERIADLEEQLDQLREEQESTRALLELFVQDDDEPASDPDASEDEVADETEDEESTISQGLMEAYLSGADDETTDEELCAALAPESGTQEGNEK